MQVSQNFNLSEPKEFTIQTTVENYPFKISIQSRRINNVWNVTVVLNGAVVRPERQSAVFKVGTLNGPIVIGLLDPDYQRGNAQLFNLSDYVDSKYSTFKTADQIGEQLVCTIRPNGNSLYFTLSQGIQGNLHPLQAE